ncbi:MAG: galactose ABC transporter substrate-binding protein [Bacteroidetes bacterium]|nr:galactose ABC transporter substrate-binding protein [Bacteroidota bacterium]
MKSRFTTRTASCGLLLLITFALIISAAGCSQQEKQTALILYNENDPFIYTFARQLEDLTSGIPNYQLETLDSQNSQILQNEQIEEMAAKGRDLLIINPVDRLGAYSLVKKMKDQEMPIIFFNREPLIEDLKLWEKAYYVGARAEQSGQLQAELIMELFGSDPDHLNRYDRNGDNIIQAVILKGEQGHQDAEIRTVEVVRAFQERGFNLEILITEVANWNQVQAFEKMEQILKTYGGDMEVLLSNNDAMAIGALDRIRQEEVFSDTNGNSRIDPLDDDWLPVVGIDGLAEAVEEIEQGYLYGTVLNDSLTQAKAIVELSEYILGKKALDQMSFEIIDDKYIWIDYKVFTLD